MTITMYGADWCGDCRRAKAFFAEHEIEYESIDLVDHPEAIDVAAELAGGRKSIPVIVYASGAVLVEPSNEELAEQQRRENAFQVVEVASEGRFELRRAGELLSFADYQTRNESDVVVPHVETLRPHRGNGYAERLMDGITEALHASGRTITPLCPFAAQYMRERPELTPLLTAA